MNDFSEGAEVVDLGSELHRDDTLLEKKFKYKLIMFTSERILVVGPLLEFFQISLQYIPAVNIDKIINQLIDHYKICMSSAGLEGINI